VVDKLRLETAPPTDLIRIGAPGRFAAQQKPGRPSSTIGHGSERLRQIRDSYISIERIADARAGHQGRRTRVQYSLFSSSQETSRRSGAAAPAEKWMLFLGAGRIRRTAAIEGKIQAIRFWPRAKTAFPYLGICFGDAARHHRICAQLYLGAQGRQQLPSSNRGQPIHPGDRNLITEWQDLERGQQVAR